VQSERWSDLDTEHHISTSSKVNSGSSREKSIPNPPSLKTRRRVDPNDEKSGALEPLTESESDSTLQELLSELKKKEEKIHRACKLELHFLNESKRIRCKRMQLVSELQQMKRKLRKMSVDTANQDHFRLPPVFCDIKNDSTASSPNISAKAAAK
jgi:hypothetical protein